MRRYPRAERAVAAVIEEACQEAGYSFRALSLALTKDEHYIRRMVRLDRECTVADLIAIAGKVGVSAKTLVGRVERRLK